MNDLRQSRSGFSGRRRAAGVALFLEIAILPAFILMAAAQAQNYRVLYSFAGTPDGANPYAGLIRDSAGNLYGTTYNGGDHGEGTVFELNTMRKEIVLYSFGADEKDGVNPEGGLVGDARGNLYGTTLFAPHNGTVFKVDLKGNETILYTFSLFLTDGANPAAGLVRDRQANLYGTTYNGGNDGWGTVFKVDPTGQETVLHSLTFDEGTFPDAGLALDPLGNLYGTTQFGGNAGCFTSEGCGTVFKVDTASNCTVLYSFTGMGDDGKNPEAGLVRDANGTLYGTTSQGGTYGYGTVFKVDISGEETVLHSFGASATDGLFPEAGLVAGAGGNLYGTTYAGGAYGNGTVFELDKTGKETILHSFTGTNGDGALPRAGLVADAMQNLYGTTSAGGAHGNGTVFKLLTN